jgi:DNA mismatch repair protein MutS
MDDRTSLLWPPAYRAGQPACGAELDAGCARDIGLAALVDALAPEAADRPAVEHVLHNLCSDPEVIRYRQAVLEDLLNRPGLAERLSALLPAIKTLASYDRRWIKERNLLGEMAWRLGELETFVEIVQGLAAAFAGAGPQTGGSQPGVREPGSPPPGGGQSKEPGPVGPGPLTSEALRSLSEKVTAIAQDPAFGNLVRELPGLLAQLRAAASVTIGVNLNERLQPVEATLLAVNDQKFHGQSLLRRLFGADKDEWQGIAPLHGVPQPGTTGAPYPGVPNDPMLVPLFRDLALVLEKAALPVAQALKRYAGINGDFLAGLRQELPFYLGALRLIGWLRAHGLPVCRPELAPADERVNYVRDSYNVDLALYLANRAGPPGAGTDFGSGTGAGGTSARGVVTNDIAFGPEGRIIVLTGPNQGGKTTYIQAIGLVQVLAQAGLYVPGREARICPVDAIFSHFPVEENLAGATGRFGDEAKRLQAIFARVTRHSLVLLNESLSSTSAGESFYIGQDILRALRLLGVRAIFSTHLHELAAGIEELNQAGPGDSLIVSMVASPVGQEAGALSFKVVFGPPLGRSYAREIAQRYGVGYDQLRSLLQERGVLDGTGG